MPTINRTEFAKLDYLEIWFYIAPDNKDAADRLLRTFDEKLEFLAEYPGAGQSRDDLGKGMRTFPVGNYIIYYQPVPGGIELLRVMHGSRDARKAFRRRRRK